MCGKWCWRTELAAVASVTIGLEAKATLKLKGLGGEALHALFFRVLRQSGSKITQLLHDADVKPFSLSPVLDGGKRHGGSTVVEAGRAIVFRVGLLSDELLNAVAAAFFVPLAAGDVLGLSGKPVVVSSIDIGSEFAGPTTFSRLLADSPKSDTLIMDFLTPTTFKSGGIQIVFPEPRLVFSSLLGRWNAFSDVPLSEEYTERFSAVMVASYDLQTELVHFSRYKVVGFKGWVEYRLPADCETDFQRAVHALARFAAYAGVGAKTTMGLGQVRCTVDRELQRLRRGND